MVYFIQQPLEISMKNAMCVFLLLCCASVLAEEAFKQENKPENLKALLEQTHKALHDKKDTKLAASLFSSLVPDEARLKKALKDGVDADTIKKISDQHKAFAINEQTVVKLAKPEQTVVKVHAATTEEIMKYEKGTPAFQEFPGGTKRVAELLLRPGTTYYEAEFLEPGKDAGMKFHLFYWDGEHWSMLGPVWRIVREPAK